MEPVAEETPEGGRARWDRRRSIWAIVAGVLVLGVVVLLVVGLVNRDVGTSIQDALDEGERPPAPGLTLPVLIAGDGIGPKGAEVSLEDLRGRTVVLNFWASWCEPCEREAPVLDRIARTYRSSGDVVVLGVDVQDLRENALEFAAEYGIRYPSLRDGGDGAYRDYQLTGLPETFVIDPQGRIALHKIGEVTRAEEITTAVDQLS
jgi:cytochrome c biogenesis protein CcmG/thiol:disulfide interchange protein DsbE